MTIKTELGALPNYDLHSISTLTSLTGSNGAPNANPLYKMNIVDKTIDTAIGKYFYHFQKIILKYFSIV